MNKVTPEMVGASRCKGFGHAWDDVPPPPWAKHPPYGFEQLFFRCLRCGNYKEYLLHQKSGAGKPKYKQSREYKELVAETRATWKLIYAANRKVLI